MPYSGVFASGNWTFTWNARASTVGLVGRLGMRVWASVNADGSSARELTSGEVFSSSVTLSTTVNTNWAITWAAPTITLTNEYLFFQLEYQEQTTAGGSNSDNALFRVGSSIVTTNFAAAHQGTAKFIPAPALTVNEDLLMAAKAALAPTTTLTAAATISVNPITAWVAAVITNGGTVSAGRQTLVDNLISGLRADGIWPKLERLWILGAENEPQALTDIVGNTLATKVDNGAGFAAFTPDAGYTGQDSSNPGTAPVINTNFEPDLAVLYKQNDAHYSAWSRTNISVANGGQLISSTGPGLNSLHVTFGDGNVYCRINDNPSSGSLGPPSTIQGHWLANRTGAGASACYQNGSLFGSPNATSDVVSGQTISLLARGDGNFRRPKYSFCCQFRVFPHYY